MRSTYISLSGSDVPHNAKNNTWVTSTEIAQALQLDRPTDGWRHSRNDGWYVAPVDFLWRILGNEGSPPPHTYAIPEPVAIQYAGSQLICLRMTAAEKGVYKYDFCREGKKRWNVLKLPAGCSLDDKGTMKFQVGSVHREYWIREEDPMWGRILLSSPQLREAYITVNYLLAAPASQNPLGTLSAIPRPEIHFPTADLTTLLQVVADNLKFTLK